MGTRSFGIQWGALNWVDWHDGHWWMTFANYDLPIGPNKTPYGHKANTLMVKLTRDFRPAELWTFPKMLLDKFELMSNSGGSWGGSATSTCGKHACSIGTAGSVASRDLRPLSSEADGRSFRLAATSPARNPAGAWGAPVPSGC